MKTINNIFNLIYSNIEVLIIADGGYEDKIIEKINENRIKINYEKQENIK